MRDPPVNMRDKTPHTAVPPGPHHPTPPSPLGSAASTAAAALTSPAPNRPPHKWRHDLRDRRALDAHAIRHSARHLDLRSHRTFPTSTGHPL
ncbi:hypothetical protein GUJ93_ZPchr0010g7353 [Zizania palustris]|uniref:Uncharacterized protein n=1 Tax=Zizania palustris TaxID=103762 RepID=A0A8J5WFL9_ZIZPA|nr:hypothetical protein GUJ93_ZPchr0010g7353 [Zizania palustris]